MSRVKCDDNLSIFKLRISKLDTTMRLLINDKDAQDAFENEI